VAIGSVLAVILLMMGAAWMWRIRRRKIHRDEPSGPQQPGGVEAHEEGGPYEKAELHGEAIDVAKMNPQEMETPSNILEMPGEGRQVAIYWQDGGPVELEGSQVRANRAGREDDSVHQ